MTARILVVDDIPANVKLLEARLIAEYFDVLTADNGRDALDICERTQVDVVLLDKRMPGMDGDEVCRRIRGELGLAMLPVLMVTGNSDVDNLSRSLAAGANDFLRKPYDPSELLARVDAAAQRKRMTDQLDNAESVLFALARMVEAKDGTTGDHCSRLSHHGVVLGKALGLAPDELMALRRGGVLHDIGKLGIPDNILLKPGPLTAPEWDIMRQHVDIGARLVGGLKSILDEAAARYSFTSPCQNLKRLKVPKADVQPFTLEKTRKLIDTCRPDYRDYVIVRAFTGMRTGEVNGLKWACVDFERREILVRETFTHGAQDKTKTNPSVREIVMSPPVHDALKRLHDMAEDRHGYVFANRNGQPFDTHNFTNRVWYPLLRYLGFRRRRPYQLRHTCATLWLTAGENPLWIARQLGHSNVEMLFRVYARWVKDVTRNDGSAFEKLLGASGQDCPTQQEAA